MEECTNEETGVGAAIAAGNHAEKGSWALLVKEHTIKKSIIDKEKYLKYM